VHFSSTKSHPWIISEHIAHSDPPSVKWFWRHFQCCLHIRVWEGYGATGLGPMCLCSSVEKPANLKLPSPCNGFDLGAMPTVNDKTLSPAFFLYWLWPCRADKEIGVCSTHTQICRIAVNFCTDEPYSRPHWSVPDYGTQCSHYTNPGPGSRMWRSPNVPALSSVRDSMLRGYQTVLCWVSIFEMNSEPYWHAVEL